MYSQVLQQTLLVQQLLAQMLWVQKLRPIAEFHPGFPGSCGEQALAIGHIPTFSYLRASLKMPAAGSSVPLGGSRRKPKEESFDSSYILFGMQVTQRCFKHPAECLGQVHIVPFAFGDLAFMAFVTLGGGGPELTLFG